MDTFRTSRDGALSGNVQAFVQFSTWLSIQQFIPDRDYIPIEGTLVGPILLIATTANLALSVKAKS